MSCPEFVGEHIAKSLAQFKTAVELCCATGMIVVQLAKHLKSACGVDIIPSRIEDAKKNAVLYGVEERTNFIVGDALDPDLLKSLPADVAILDPEWNMQGVNPPTHANNIDDTQPSTREMFNLTKRYITPNVVIKIPKSFTFETLSEFGQCRIENIIWDGNLRFKLAYFLNNIAKNQEMDIFLINYCL
ncbi:MAG: hypothetical protein UY92_C0014G0039 [Candidatus Magasanikbacteria bacterium GW2011_GWA2_56_11]|uniref:Methyltransferase domain-containing protein n=1 Tax=Candidatus Magasanikbacteria bacterium GW2011_GWA2_56_11 TaxID=1619044 RepID=A0A0G2B8G2_9BACT|nr:MAG: hypothetical protein UY92_C0014G0039 [Candidatus Magasanikbacteria bacterium GW2011_GWA2_56_11]